MKLKLFAVVTLLLVALGSFSVASAQGEAQTQQTIAEIAAGNPDFSTLVTALQAADLVETLDSPGSYTVFAPTNAAFAKLPAGTVEGLLADKAALTRVLLYHVVAGRVPAAQVVNLSSAQTLAGAPVSIAVNDDGVFLNGNVRVTVTDIQASNGIIHVIDAVLLPPAAPPAGPTKNIVEIAVEDGRFTTLVAAVQAAGLVNTLSGPGPFTVFAPTDAAFAALPPGFVSALLAEPGTPTLRDILLYHVVSGRVPASQVVNLTSAGTALGEDVAISVSGGSVFVNNARVIITDIQATNGIIHVIDAVLVPERSAAGAPGARTVTFPTEDAQGNIALVNDELVVSWNPAGLSDENGAYRVTARQYLPAHALGSFEEIVIAYHFAEAGETFEFSDLSVFAPGVPTYVVVTPVTFVKALNTSTGTYEYTYTPTGSAAQWSEVFYAN